MKKITEPIKNIVTEPEQRSNTFSTFMSRFSSLKKINNTFYGWDNRNVDYTYIQGEAKKAGIKEIPSQEELSQLVS